MVLIFVFIKSIFGWAIHKHSLTHTHSRCIEKVGKSLSLKNFNSQHEFNNILDHSKDACEHTMCSSYSPHSRRHIEYIGFKRTEDCYEQFTLGIETLCTVNRCLDGLNGQLKSYLPENFCSLGITLNVSQIFPPYFLFHHCQISPNANVQHN